MQTRVSTTSPFFLIAASGALALAGCVADEQSADDEDVEVAEQAMTSNEGAGEITAFSAVFAEHADLSAAGSQLESHVEDAECVTVEGDEGSATFVFDGCVGRRGFVSITGTLEVEVRADGSIVTYDFSSDELYLNRVEIAGAWQVVVDEESGTRTWDGGMTMTGPHGHQVETSTSASWLVEGECVTYSASSEITGPLGGVRTVEVDEVTRCAGQCPSGGAVEVEFPGGRTLSWTYNGDDTATVTGPRGREFDVLLPCGY